MRKLIQKIKCSIPFNFVYFGHKNIKSVRWLSNQSQLVECLDCGRRFAMNHSERIILPWGDVEYFYRENFLSRKG